MQKGYKTLLLLIKVLTVIRTTMFNHILPSTLYSIATSYLIVTRIPF